MRHRMGSQRLDNLRFLPRVRLNGERTLSGSETCCLCVVEKRDRKGSDGDLYARYVVMWVCARMSPILTTSAEIHGKRGRTTFRPCDAERRRRRINQVRSGFVPPTRGGGEIGFSEMKGANRVAID